MQNNIGIKKVIRNAIFKVANTGKIFPIFTQFGHKFHFIQQCDRVVLLCSTCRPVLFH